MIDDEEAKGWMTPRTGKVRRLAEVGTPWQICSGSPRGRWRLLRGKSPQRKIYSYEDLHSEEDLLRMQTHHLLSLLLSLALQVQRSSFKTVLHSS